MLPPVSKMKSSPAPPRIVSALPPPSMVPSPAPLRIGPPSRHRWNRCRRARRRQNRPRLSSPVSSLFGRLFDGCIDRVAALAALNLFESITCLRPSRSNRSWPRPVEGDRLGGADKVKNVNVIRAFRPRPRPHQRSRRPGPCRSPHRHQSCHFRTRPGSNRRRRPRKLNRRRSSPACRVASASHQCLVGRPAIGPVRTRRADDGREIAEQRRTAEVGIRNPAIGRIAHRERRCTVRDNEPI